MYGKNREIMARNRINIVPDKGLRIALIQKSQGPA
jgi:hypothetical protein